MSALNAWPEPICTMESSKEDDIFHEIRGVDNRLIRDVIVEKCLSARTLRQLGFDVPEYWLLPGDI